MSDQEKDVEILLLRQQLRIIERKQKRGPNIPRWQKVPLAALAIRLKEAATSSHTALKECIRLFKPDTLIGWHLGSGEVEVEGQTGEETGPTPD